MTTRELKEMIDVIEDLYGDLDINFQDLSGNIHPIDCLGYGKDIVNISTSQPKMIVLLEKATP